ncbi:hypothetical protein YC2023_061127 [Brassica napus]
MEVNIHQNAVPLIVQVSTFLNFMEEKSDREAEEWPSKYSKLFVETAIRQKISSDVAFIYRSIDEICAEMDRIGRPVVEDSGVNSNPTAKHYFNVIFTPNLLQ